jgi:fatty-acyl-CoA synthase
VTLIARSGHGICACAGLLRRVRPDTGRSDTLFALADLHDGAPTLPGAGTNRPSAGAFAHNTLNATLEAAVATGTARVVFHLREGERSLGIDEVLDFGSRAARRLRERGVGPGDRVAVLGPNRPEWLIWAVATWFAGATLVPVQIPLRRRDPAAFTAQLAHIIGASSARVVMADPDLMRFVPGDGGMSWGIDELPTRSVDDQAGPTPDDIAVLQFTSGSSARPKGAQLPHRAVAAQLSALTRGMGGTAECGVAWAPFFHDLGLFGCLLAPIVMGATTHHLPTELFARAPDEWLRLCSVHRANITVAPSSSWSIALRTVLRRGESLDLSDLHHAYFAAEGIDPDVVEALLKASAGLGLDPASVAGTYGMAETVLAVTITPLGEGMRSEPIDIERLSRDGVATAGGARGRTRRIISSGSALEGMELRINGPDGPAADRRLGEIHVRGASMMQGYDDGSSPAPAPFLDDGWLQTGDTGFVADGELFVTGRIKDMVIVGGHNYHAEDFEWAAERVAGVRRGRAVAFGREDSEEVVVVVEPEDLEAFVTLGPQVRLGVGNAIGVVPTEVVVVERGSVLKTSSGKTRRLAMKAAHHAGELRHLGPTAPACGER